VNLFDEVKNVLHPGGESTVAAGKDSEPSDSPATGQHALAPAIQGRVLLIHGYSADWTAFLPWKRELAKAGIAATMLDIGNYITLNNEVTIKDLGEAFDRALRLTKFADGVTGEDWTFDAIVHSTGMLVVRQWLTSDPFAADDPRSRVRRLKHLVGLAPATFGSPQARKGRSWLGALVKGNKDLGPDFLNAGDMVLDGLELASRFTWDLAQKDMICLKPFYDKGDKTPYVAVFIGNIPYSGISAIANSPGCDGTVRWAGCALNTRKITLDLRRNAQIDPKNPMQRCSISDFSDERLGAPIVAIDDQNHGTIVSEPAPQAVGLVRDFLSVTQRDEYEQWETKALASGADAKAKMDTSDGLAGGAGWQQLVIHMVDDHGDGVTDYNLRLFYGNDLSDSDDPDFASVPLIADTYSSDASYRCFYLHLTKEMLSLKENGKKMWIELIASSGSQLIEYEAYTGSPDDPQRLAIDSHTSEKNKLVKMDITQLTEDGASLFFPYTTTLLEIHVEREPMPLGDVSNLFTFPELIPK
jgi:hypothetical protein